MSWRDEEQGRGWERLGRPGGDWRGLRPSFDNPMTWSLPLWRVGGITVRIHILFLLFIVIMLLRALASPQDGQPFSWFDVTFVAVGLGSLFTIVLMHEFGHCLACRWSGGEADEILMWPLGGLAYCQPPQRWSAHLVTALGGPAVNVVFCLVAGLLLGLQTGHWLGAALPNLLDPYAALVQYDLRHSWPLIILFVVNWTSLVLLLFNLLPVFPLDGGRIVQALLWPRVGYVRSMRLAVRVGYVGAILLGIWGAVIGNWLLLGIAVFGGVTCYLTHRQLEFTESIFDEESPVYASGAAEPDESGSAPRPSRLERRQAEREAAESRQVDRILQKIAGSGMDSLTIRERRLLKRHTERKRKGEQGRD